MREREGKGREGEGKKEGEKGWGVSIWAPPLQNVLLRPCVPILIMGTLRGLNFADLGKIAKLSPSEKFATGPSAKLNPHEKI